MAEYEFVSGFRNSGRLDAQKAGEVLAIIAKENDKDIWPEKTVEVARPIGHVLHSHFNWDDAAAAHEHRLSQARLLHRSIVVVKKDPRDGSKKKERAFVHVREPDKKRSPYRTVEDIVNDEAWREQMRYQSWKDLHRAQQRLKRWDEFATVCSLLDKAKKALEDLSADQDEDAA